MSVAETKENIWTLNEFAGETIRMRNSDGYFNGKDMCKVKKNKLMKDYLRNTQTQEFVEELKKEVGNGEKLIEIITTGPNENRGTWVHPRVATDLAAWISTKFKVRTTEWIEEWRQVEGNNKKYLKELCILKPSYSNQRELEIQLKLKKELNAEIEVETSVGYIDLVTETKIIEIKEASNWKHGLGQILCYGTEYPNHKKVIVLFGEVKNIKNIKKIYDKFEVELIVM